MKILAWIGGILLVIIATIYGLLFTNLGNSLLKPSIEKIVAQKVGMDFALDKFKLSFNTIDIAARLNKELLLNIKGKYNIFKTHFDLVYETNAVTLMNMQVDLKLNGTIAGYVGDFTADGIGFLTGSNLRFATRIKEFAPFELKLDAKDLDLQALSLIAMQKAYISGKLSATADIVNAKGKAQISAPKILVTKLAQQDFGIDLPQDFNINLNSDIDINANVFKAVTNILTPIATANAKNTSFNLDRNELISDLNINIENLAKLEPIIKQKLSGSVKIEANTKISHSKMKFLDANISGLGGEVIAHLKDNTLEANIKNIKLAEILALASMPPLAKSDINAQAKISNIYDMKNIKGNANINLDNGLLDYKQINEMLSTDLKANVAFNMKNNIDIQNEILKFTSNLSSPVVQNFDAVGEYRLTQNNLKADLSANIAELGAILGSKVKSQADIKANIDIKDNNITSAIVDFAGFGGSINAKLQNNALQANIKNIQLSNAFGFLAMDTLLSGILNGNFNLNDLNFDNLNGGGKFSITNGKFNEKELSKFLGTQFPKDIKFSAEFAPNIKNSIVNFNSNFISDIAELSKFEGSYNINKSLLNSSYYLKIADLSKLSFLTGVALHSPLNIQGKLQTQNDAITASATSDIFNSNTNINFAKNTLNADIKNAKIEEILAALGYSKFYLGDTNVNLVYQVDKASGEFNADILKANLAKSELTTLISSVLQKDITSEVFENGKVVGTIKNDILKFDANLHSNKVNINTTNANINTKTNALKIPLKANIEKTDIQIDITGTTNKPKYNLSSDYLKEKAKQGLSKLFDKTLGGGGEDNAQNETQNKNDTNIIKNPKDLIKDLRKLF